jgi:MFS family permease
MIPRVQSIAVETPASSRTLTALCLIALIVGFVGNLAIQLPNIVLAQAAASGLAIGASTAAQALGIVVSGPLAVYLFGRAGSAHVLLIGCCVAAIGLTCLSMTHAILPITLSRLVLATGIGLMVIVSQHVVAARAPRHRRATLIAIYAFCFSLGTAIAPGLISLVAPNYPVAYGIALGSLVIAAIGMGTADLRARIEHTSWKALGVVFSPAGPSFWAAFIYGIVDNGLLALLAVYALRRGYSVADASTIAMAGFLGILLLQVPIGHLSDRTSPRLVLFASTLTAIACLVILVVAHPSWPLMIAFAFVLGGLCDAFYTVGLADMNQRIPKTALAKGNACFILFCGLGEIVGPSIGGSGFDLFGSDGLIAAFVAVLVVYLAFQVAATLRFPANGFGKSHEGAS